MPENNDSTTYHILVMDDEPSVRGLLNKFLQTCGYRVTTASEGMEAYQLYIASLESDHPVNAIIMDLIVNNGLGGLDSFRLIRKANPDAVGIVSSAYSEDSAMSDHEKYGFSAVLPKPYQLLELKRTLEDLLEPKYQT